MRMNTHVCFYVARPPPEAYRIFCALKKISTVKACIILNLLEVVLLAGIVAVDTD